ncbi:MAG: hypothetical protein K0U50_09720, partial [Alphaproteobacteria bacterium]|nr:hypothetical protein [Alphaproteobacteria bacterium]
MKNTILMSFAGLALAACAPAIPDSGAPNAGDGVGFGSYQEYSAKEAAREAQLSQTALPGPNAVGEEILGTPESDVASEVSAGLHATRPSGQVLNASPSNPAPAVINAAG